MTDLISKVPRRIDVQRVVDSINSDLLKAGNHLLDARQKIAGLRKSGAWAVLVDSEGNPYTDWTHFAESEFRVSYQRICQLVDAAYIDELLGTTDRPILERQARELAPIKSDPALVVQAWDIAKATAEKMGRQISAKVVESAREVMQEIKATGHVDVGEEVQLSPTESSVQSAILQNIGELIERQKAHVIEAVERRIRGKIKEKVRIVDYSTVEVALSAEPDELVLYVEPEVRDRFVSLLRSGEKTFQVAMWRLITEDMENAADESK